MRRTFLAIAIALAIGLPAGPATAKTVDLRVSPNPASVGDRVAHVVEVGVTWRLDVWVSARGFAQPRMGTLPSGTWTYVCCPAQTAGTPAWHYRSAGPVAPGSYRFAADARTRGTFLSTAAVGGVSASVWVQIR